MNTLTKTPAQPPPPEPEPRKTPAQNATKVTPAQLQGDPESPSATKRQRTADRSVKSMPIQYENCNPKDLGILIANMLMELIRLNDPIPLRDGRLTRFHSRAPPGISCHDYLQRLIQHATLSPPILLSMVYYIDRLCALYPAFTISSLTVHRFLITAATVAAKGLSDSFWTNPTYARIGGISTSELATLEMEFLQRVEWRIVPKPEVLVDYYVSLVSRSEGYELEKEESDEDGVKMEEDPT
ncbi:Pho80p cyclin [Zalaria obscura]|uniref:Pho80p cyclin n=1 Tax=Zalaria obscura TaxID=2024903 RepID=A0ACC3S7K3_9PEZI